MLSTEGRGAESARAATAESGESDDTEAYGRYRTAGGHGPRSVENAPEDLARPFAREEANGVGIRWG